uniref:Uncharacterized protein n=1 Tax=Setaria digitata TaxID=48799 RepID=A0A915PXJ3_9BILA
MACWTLSLDGGPTLPNQAATTLGRRVYSFGDYFAPTTDDNTMRIFGIHVLNIDSYRWRQIVILNDNDLGFPATLLERIQQSSLSSSVPQPNNIMLSLGEAPSRRAGHTVVTYEGKIYLWGGYKRALPLSSTMYCFDPEKRTWSKVPCKGEMAPGRTKHTAVVYNDMMIVYGGLASDLSLPRSVQAYHFKERKWCETEVKGEIPTGRQLHTACVIGKKMYVFGGRSYAMHELQMDVLNFETGCWEKPTVTGDIPAGRENHCTWVYRDRMYIFGGYQRKDDLHLNTLYEFDPAESKWRRVIPFGFKNPIRRQRQKAVVIGDRVFLSGGTTPSSPCEPNVLDCISDLHVLNYGLQTILLILDIS